MICLSSKSRDYNLKEQFRHLFFPLCVYVCFECFFFMFLLSQYSFWLQTKDKTLPWFPKAQRDIVKHLVFPNQKSKNRRHLDRTIMQNEKRVTVLNI